MFRFFPDFSAVLSLGVDPSSLVGSSTAFFSATVSKTMVSTASTFASSFAAFIAVAATAAEVSTAMATMRIDGRLADVKASQLSAGQRRRCALASLIVRRAEIWLLDEPHAGLDAAGRDELDVLLRSAVASGATVVLASHERDRALGLATRIVTIDGGGAT